MKLFRIDAMQIDDAGDECGLLTMFAVRSYVEIQQRMLLRSGWDVDAYEEEAAFTDDEAESLTGQIWPTLPVEELIGMAKDPKLGAMAQLAAILADRGQAFAGAAIGPHRQADAEERWEPADRECEGK